MVQRRPVFASGASAFALLAGLMLAVLLLARPARAEAPVDVALILAVDVSYSMDEEEQKLQREGYALGITSRDVLQAIARGRYGRIAVAYVEWAGALEQQVLIDWRIVDGDASAKAFAAELLGKPYRRISRTSISGALIFSAPLFDKLGLPATRRVIDVSGDGPNNQGLPVEQVRDDIVGRGITVNGLPIVLKRPYRSMFDIDDLDIYYRDCVIGGEGAFMIPVRDLKAFGDAVRTKLLLEVAGLMPPAGPAPRALPAAAGPTVSCMIGERQWRERWGN